jgi:hypothetical protein
MDEKRRDLIFESSNKGSRGSIAMVVLAWRSDGCLSSKEIIDSKIDF